MLMFLGKWKYLKKYVQMDKFVKIYLYYSKA